jgi:DNA-binding NarL/FixJ family response regulator
MKGKKLGIVVADDSKMFCESLAALLEKIPNVQWVYTAYDGKQAIEIVRKHQIDLALLDVRMPIMDGLQAAEIILKEHAPTLVIGMTSFDEEATLLDLLRAGVHGILLKRSANRAELTSAINEVMNGRNYYNEEIRHVVDKNIHRLNVSSRTSFTTRELEILRFTSTGKVAKEIAVALNLSTGSVETYRKELLRKTNTKNVAELVTFAHRNGLL